MVIIYSIHFCVIMLSGKSLKFSLATQETRRRNGWFFFTTVNGLLCLGTKFKSSNFIGKMSSARICKPLRTKSQNLTLKASYLRRLAANDSPGAITF